MINLMDLSRGEIEEYILSLNQPLFRAKQIYSWVNSGVADFDEMTNVPKSLRDRLREDGAICGCLEPVKKLISAVDGTVKYLYKLYDGNLIESVVMEYKHGTTICVSTQVGCKMGCTFCASCESGFVRNLSAGEILSQVITSNRDLNKKISNVVLMGIGEPFDNYDNVVKFIKLANDERGLNMGNRHFTVSTSGIVPRILDFIKDCDQVNLSISLHASSDSKRSAIMPINNKYSIDKLVEICKIYTKETRRRITFEYALIAGENDDAKDAEALGKLIKNMLCHVNLIPVNPVFGKSYTKSSKQVIGKFIRVLESYGVTATVRREMGTDINAACGQLRASNI